MVIKVFEDIYKTLKSGRQAMLVTVVEKTGEGPQIVGAKMLVSSDGTKIGTVGGGTLEQTAYARSLELLRDKKCLLEKYDLTCDHCHKDAKGLGMACGGSITLFYELISPGKKLYIFGGGHVSRAIVQHAKNLNYNITVIDHRENIFQNFEGANQTIEGNYEEIIKDLDISDESFVVIATSEHKYDFTVLKGIYEAGYKPAYIGMLASRTKTKGAVGFLRKYFGDTLDLSSLYTPVGLDIGGSTPDEIAISILAEMQGVKYNRNGHKHMRETWYI